MLGKHHPCMLANNLEMMANYYQKKELCQQRLEKGNWRKATKEKGGWKVVIDPGRQRSDGSVVFQHFHCLFKCIDRVYLAWILDYGMNATWHNQNWLVEQTREVSLALNIKQPLPWRTVRYYQILSFWLYSSLVTASCQTVFPIPMTKWVIILPLSAPCVNLDFECVWSRRLHIRMSPGLVPAIIILSLADHSQHDPLIVGFYTHSLAFVADPSHYICWLMNSRW